MIALVIGFLLGIVSLNFFKALPDLFLLFLVILSLLTIGFFSPIKLIRFFLTGFSIGFLWIFAHANYLLLQQIPSDLEGKPFQVVGRIQSVPKAAGGTQFEFKIDLASSLSAKEPISWPNPGLVRIFWPKPTHTVKAGEKWRFPIKLKRPHAYANPGGFDIEKSFFQKRLVASGSVTKGILPERLESSGIHCLFDQARAFLQEIITKSLKNKPFSGIIQALVTGLQDKISLEQWRTLRNTGTAHLVAISGLHIGLLTSFIYYLVGFIWQKAPTTWLKIPYPIVAAFSGILIAFIYAGLAGFSIPTQRAFISVVMVMLMIIQKRTTRTWRHYCLTIGIVLLIDPFATLSVGFWLSFGAVAVILYGMQSRLKPTGFWWKWGRIQWVVFLGLMPVSVATFGSAPIVSPLANSIAIPWVSFIVVPLALLGTVVSLLHSDGGSHLLHLAEWGLSILWPLLEWFDSGIGSKIGIISPQATPSVWAMIAFFCGIFLILLPRGLAGKWIGLVFIIPFFLEQPIVLAPNQARITVLDVGQGLATVVHTQNHTLLFDTGPKLSPSFNTGNQVVLPFLKSEGIKNLDMLMISHGDNDHAGAREAILNGISVKDIMTSEPELFPNRIAKRCVIGDYWQWDGVSFEILHPSGTAFKKRNDHCCVLKVKAGAQSVLLTGDIEAPAEYEIIQNHGYKLISDVLIVPHHGSKTSSTLEFIQAIKPKHAIIPAGYRNQYKHPRPEIIKRYQDAHIPILETVQEGAISFILNSGKPTLDFQCYRRDNTHYWSHKI